MIRKDNGSNNSLFLSCQMGLSDGAFFMIKHTPLPNGNHPIAQWKSPHFEPRLPNGSSRYVGAMRSWASTGLYFDKSLNFSHSCYGGLTTKNKKLVHYILRIVRTKYPSGVHTFWTLGLFQLQNIQRCSISKGQTLSPKYAA